MLVMELIVKPVTSKEIVRDYVLNYCERQGWAPGKMDDVLYWVAGPEKGAGLYVGELHGQPITGVAMVQHNEVYAYVSMFFCEEEHRGKGYALKTWKTTREALNPQTNLCLDAVLSATAFYERDGFKRSFATIYDYFSVSSILRAYETLSMPDGVTIAAATEVNFAKLKFYVEDVMGFTFAQNDLLEKWITLPTHKALVAVQNGDIAGFCTLKECINLEGDGYQLAPLLADSGDIARLLLFKL